jgi:hypothetical protein
MLPAVHACVHVFVCMGALGLSRTLCGGRRAMGGGMAALASGLLRGALRHRRTRASRGVAYRAVLLPVWRLRLRLRMRTRRQLTRLEYYQDRAKNDGQLVLDTALPATLWASSSSYYSSACLLRVRWYAVNVGRYYELR